MLLRSRWLGSSSFALVVVIAGAAHVGCSSDSSTGGGNATDAGATGSDAGGSSNDAGTGNDAGSANDAATEAGAGTKKFGEACSTDAECASNACFMGGAQSYCSFHCTAGTASTDCPMPPTSGTCNNQGYCKK